MTQQTTAVLLNRSSYDQELCLLQQLLVGHIDFSVLHTTKP